MRAGERTLDATWIDRVFELHHLTMRPIDAPTLFQLSRLANLLKRTDAGVLGRYLEETIPRTTDPGARSRMLRLQLLTRS
jgi:hypothetical protein